MLIASKWLPRASALALLSDLSGLAGPRVWSGGKYPAEQAQFPVMSVSWYEANAYAQWAGAQLPTGDQWWRAALGDDLLPFPWGNDGLTVEQRANFGLAGPVAVGSMRLGVSPFGARHGGQRARVDRRRSEQPQTHRGGRVVAGPDLHV